MRRFALLLPVLALTGCKAIFPSTTDCTERLPYMDAQEVPRLVIPEGMDAPNTQAALRIPEVRTPERPNDGRCLDYPPRYRNTPPPPSPNATTPSPPAASQVAPEPGA
jgi:uncharacterized lipoprotein